MSRDYSARYKFSIHALLAEGDAPRVQHLVYALWISIHALLAEGDNIGDICIPCAIISIHTLLAEGDHCA